MIEFDKIYNEDCLVGMERIPDNNMIFCEECGKHISSKLN